MRTPSYFSKSGELFIDEGSGLRPTWNAHSLARSSLEGALPPYGDLRDFDVEAPTEEQADRWPIVTVTFGIGNADPYRENTDHDRIMPLSQTQWEDLRPDVQLALRGLAGMTISPEDVASLPAVEQVPEVIPLRPAA